MTVRSPLAIAIVVLFALLGGCAQDSAPPSSRSVPGQGDPAAANPDDGGGKQKQDAQRSAPATTREQFMPILERAYGRVSWPSSYTMTPDKLWAFMSAGARVPMLETRKA